MQHRYPSTVQIQHCGPLWHIQHFTILSMSNFLDLTTLIDVYLMHHLTSPGTLISICDISTMVIQYTNSWSHWYASNISGYKIALFNTICQSRINGFVNNSVLPFPYNIYHSTTYTSQQCYLRGPMSTTSPFRLLGLVGTHGIVSELCQQLPLCGLLAI